MKYIGGEVELNEGSSESILNDQNSGSLVGYIFHSLVIIVTLDEGSIHLYPYI